jgi:uncharacterized protein (TIGR03435 family)
MSRLARRVAVGVGLGLLALAGPRTALAGLGPGDPAVFQRERILLADGLGELTAEDLAGKAVVLEFWATWCIACIADFPRWNEMAETFAEEPVAFVSVTDEGEATVRPFLESRRLRGFVVLDEDRSLFEAYGATARPHTVLIDAQGTVRAAGFLRKSFSTANLRALLAGEPLDVPDDERPVAAELLAGTEAGAGAGTGGAEGAPGAGRETAAPLFQALIRPSSLGRLQVIESSEERYAFLGMRPSHPYSVSYGVASNRFEFEDGAKLPEGSFDFLFHTPGRPDLLQPLLRQALEASFGLEVRKETREIDAFELRVAEGATLKLDTAIPDEDTPMFDAAPGHLESRVTNMILVTGLLGDVFGAPLSDATGNREPFHLVLDWDPDDPDGLRKALREQLGVEVVPVRREVGFLIFRPAENGGTPKP